jgi:hypothetical protein
MPRGYFAEEGRQIPSFLGVSSGAGKRPDSWLGKFESPFVCVLHRFHVEYNVVRLYQCSAIYSNSLTMYIPDKSVFT